MNPLAEKLTGWEQKDAIGKNLSEIFSLLSEERYTTLIHKDGVEIAIEKSSTPIQDENGNILGNVVVFRDIRELKQTQDTLTHLVQQLSRSNEQLAKFASIVSHDLKSPLRLVTGFAHLLADRYGKSLDAEGNEFIAHILEGATRTELLINELLLSAQTGEPKTVLSEINCNLVLNKVRANLKSI